jgi:hypothetical protein
MIMEGRGWHKTGKKGSLGVRSRKEPGTANHNVGGLAFWFIRAERYTHAETKPYPSVRSRCRHFESKAGRHSATKRQSANGRVANRPGVSQRTDRREAGKK